MPVPRQRKLEVARRSYELLTGEYGVPPEDLIFDALVFPCATGDENYLGSAEETIEGVRLIKEALPLARTVLGISNVSFGLPEAGREVPNPGLLYRGVQAVAAFRPGVLAGAPPGFEEQGLAVVEEGLNQGADPVRIRRAARLLQGYELLYWDTMWEAAQG